MEINEFGYYAKTVAEQLGVDTSTLRKWAIELERCGYEFKRNVNNHRSYYEKDIQALIEMKKQLDLQHSLRDVAKYIVKEMDTGRFDEEEAGNNASITPSVIDNNHVMGTGLARVDEFYHLMMQSNQMIGEMAEQLKKRDEEMLAKLEQQEKEKAELKEELELLKNKLDIAVDYIQKQEAKDEDKKGFWKKLFG